ncbi:MAG: DMT family transporter [Halobacteriota archaeon]
MDILISNLKRHRNILLFVLLSILWGTSFAAIAVGLEALPPLLFAALRYDIAGVLLLGYALLATDQWRPRGREEWTLVTIGGLLVVGVHYALLFTGQTYVTSGVAAIVMSTSPILTPLFAWLLLPDERLGVPGVIGVFFGLVGVALVAAPEPHVVDGTAVGVALLVLSAASFAVGAVFVKRHPARMPIVPSQAWMMLIGAASLHASSLLFGEAQFGSVSWTPAVLASLSYLAIGASSIGLVVYFDLLNRIGAIETSLVNYVVPAVAALFGWVLLSESVTGDTIAGFAVIVVGFGFLKWEAVFPRIVALEARLSRGYPVEDEFVDVSAFDATESPRAFPADD